MSNDSAIKFSGNNTQKYKVLNEKYSKLKVNYDVLEKEFERQTYFLNKRICHLDQNNVEKNYMLDHMQKTIDDMELILLNKSCAVAALKKELATENQELAAKNQKLATENQELAAKNQELAADNQELVIKTQELVIKTQELAAENSILLEKLALAESKADKSTMGSYVCEYIYHLPSDILDWI